MKIPKFLRNLLQSNNYWNKNSAEFAKANEYLEKLFPGKLQRNANGQYIEPKYDMTYEQFINAQKKLDEAIQDAIQYCRSGSRRKRDVGRLFTICGGRRRNRCSCFNALG